MGNCAPKPRRRWPPPSPSPPPPPPPPPPPAIHPSSPLNAEIRGPESCPIAARIHVALLYKGAAAKLVLHSGAATELRLGSESVTGSSDLILRFVDSKLPSPPAVAPDPDKEGRWPSAAATEDVAAVVALQHRSIETHLEGVMRWAADASAAAKVGVVVEGRARKAARRYGDLVEIMLEHAQMEERILFPLIERASDDSGVGGRANEEHARALPMMNGIKEEMKWAMTMKPGDACFREALLILSSRLHKLQVHCVEHFEEEEKALLPLLNGGDGVGLGSSWEERRRWVERVVESMEITHSRLFPVLMSGLAPAQALQYIDLVYRCVSGQPRQVAAMLHWLAAWLEGLPGPPSAFTPSLKPL